MSEASALLTVEVTTWSANYARHADSDRPAVISPADAWSFRQLSARAGRWAGWVRRLNLDPGAPLPALVGSAADTYALWLGAPTTGHPLMPLGVRLTPTEVAACVHDDDAAVLVVEPEYAVLGQQAAALTGQSVVVLPADPGPGEALELDAAAEDVLMVLHTSGTTGVPKRVSFRQDRMAVRVAVYSALLELRGDSVYSSSQQFHHVGGIGLLAVALGAGAAVVPPTPRFTRESWTALSTLGVTHATVVPTMIETLLEAGELAFPTLRVLTYGASPIRPETAGRLRAEHPTIGLLQGYSQTEGGPISALTPADHVYAVEHAPRLLGSVGRSVGDVELVIDGPDADGVGEVWARGAHLAQPSEDGWLRTGDLGSVDSDGYLYLSGRKGDMIIRGGENVYPEEVEAVLRRHPQVLEAAVVGRPDTKYGEQVAAFIVATDAATPPDIDGLEAFLRAELSGFKIPASWTFLSELPRGALGKVLRRELRGRATA